MKRFLGMAVIALVFGLLVIGSRMPAQAQDAPTKPATSSRLVNQSSSTPTCRPTARRHVNMR